MGWWHSQLNGNIKVMCQTTSQLSSIFNLPLAPGPDVVASGAPSCAETPIHGRSAGRSAPGTTALGGCWLSTWTKESLPWRSERNSNPFEVHSLSQLGMEKTMFESARFPCHNELSFPDLGRISPISPQVPAIACPSRGTRWLSGGQHTMWGPLVISWFISPNNYSYKYSINHSYWSYWHQLSYLLGAPLCIFLLSGLGSNFHIFF